MHLLKKQELQPGDFSLPQTIHLKVKAMAPQL